MIVMSKHLKQFDNRISLINKVAHHAYFVCFILVFVVAFIKTSTFSLLEKIPNYNLLIPIISKIFLVICFLVLLTETYEKWIHNAGVFNRQTKILFGIKLFVLVIAGYIFYFRAPTYKEIIIC